MSTKTGGQDTVVLMDKFHFGFTGTQRGMSAQQRVDLYQVIDQLVRAYGAKNLVAHHGDCIGGDGEFHDLVKSRDIWTISHPPLHEEKRAFCKADETKDPEPYLIRNRNIVRESKLLVAAPLTDQEVIRSGTWSTIRAARRWLIPLLVLPR